MNNKIKVGIIGCGFVGTALKTWLLENNPLVEVKVSDPPKGINEDISLCDAYFIQIHIPTDEFGKQNLQILESIINSLPNNKPIWIRTTILPGTSDWLTSKTGKIVYHMPEFLTERTYLDDFKWQTMIFTGSQEHVELLKKIFHGKKYIVLSSKEAELAKYAHNVFGSLKVTYFNCIYDLCQKMDLDYNKVLQAVLASTYINDTHTQVPGPDGKLGFGGKCFPKDVRALEQYFRYTPLGRLLEPIMQLNKEFRQEDLM